MAAGLTRGLRNFIVPVMLFTSALALSACQSKTASLDGADDMKTGSMAPGSFSKTADLGKRWGADQKNIELGLAYADGLEKMGQTEQQFSVLQTLSIQNPANYKLQSIYGKKLIATGRAADSVPILEAVTTNGGGDWRTYSALGSAYDQQGQYAQARESYQKALSMQPNEISVLNNMGMSYALEGNLKQGETTLRSAMALPQGQKNPRIRQNLALVVGLQGRFEESRQIASEDLPPEEVEANMAYLQKMLSQPNTWQQLSTQTPG